MAIWCLPQGGRDEGEGGKEPNRGRVEVREVKCGGGGYVMLCGLFPTAAVFLFFSAVQLKKHRFPKFPPEVNV